MNSNPYQQYQKQSVMTASSAELLLMLYNGCIKFIKLARQAIEDKDVQKSHNNLIKAQNIILEFMNTLDLDFEVSKSLMPLYEFIYWSLVRANVENDTQKLDEALELVTELRSTWAEAAKLTKTHKAVGG